MKPFRLLLYIIAVLLYIISFDVIFRILFFYTESFYLQYSKWNSIGWIVLSLFTIGIIVKVWGLIKGVLSLISLGIAQINSLWKFQLIFMMIVSWINAIYLIFDGVYYNEVQDFEGYIILAFYIITIISCTRVIAGSHINNNIEDKFG